VKLIICPALNVPQVFQTHRPSHVLGLLSPGQDQIDLPHESAHRLELRFNDIAAQQLGLVMPDETHLDAILNFAITWNGEAPLLIYCFAGISRSTATAFSIACQRQPSVAECDIAKALREASMSATPNPLMIALADGLLQRQGRMSEAALSIGRGQGMFQGEAFELACDALI
jgi:predicted protein tyrosine phosphatase